ncbi:SDR family NAD-dependent epimerase/dehydratase, partial [Candidatus Uhrbacteria bacterium]|nr:SDR family NAD-dependent epimerase/dehydratase [Candidatus Uhrbacteria bacterium]
SDVVDGPVRLMAAEKGIGPVNIGSDQDHRLVEVCQKIIEMTESSSKVVFEKPLLFMTPLGLPDLTKAKEKLSWIPIVSLEHGLKMTIDYAKAQHVLLTPKK